MVDDVLVQVNELVFPTDFYMLEMVDEASPNQTPILLGRPFLKTTRAMINVQDGLLTMEFDVEVIKFNIFEVMRYHNDRCNELETPLIEFQHEENVTKTQRRNAAGLGQQW